MKSTNKASVSFLLSAYCKHSIKDRTMASDSMGLSRTFSTVNLHDRVTYIYICHTHTQTNTSTGELMVSTYSPQLQPHAYTHITSMPKDVAISTDCELAYTQMIPALPLKIISLFVSNQSFIQASHRDTHICTLWQHYITIIKQLY